MINILRKLRSNNLSITFIGMPGSGKSFLSKKISDLYKIKLEELDYNIEKKYDKPLFELIDFYGEKKFIEIEENIIKDINFNKQNIISTGGSIIYCKNGIKHLQNNNNLIIHLDTDFNILKKRTNNFTNRAIVFNGLTHYELYKSRNKLYKKYSDISMKTTDKNINLLTESLIYFL